MLRALEHWANAENCRDGSAYDSLAVLSRAHQTYAVPNSPQSNYEIINVFVTMERGGRQTKALCTSCDRRIINWLHVDAIAMQKLIRYRLANTRRQVSVSKTKHVVDAGLLENCRL